MRWTETLSWVAWLTGGLVVLLLGMGYLHTMFPNPWFEPVQAWSGTGGVVGLLAAISITLGLFLAYTSATSRGVR